MNEIFQKFLFIVTVMGSDYNAQLNPLTLIFIYNADYFYNMFFSFDIFLKHEMETGTLFSQMKIHFNSS